jgi:hypothetical protein
VWDRLDLRTKQGSWSALVAYLRTVRTGSGATAVQIVHGSRRGARDIEHLGSAHDEQAVEALKAVARQRLAGGQGYADDGWRRKLAAACAAHAELGPTSLVMFDVSTLYFETDAGDGIREPGFPKERRLEPQITIGLLTDASGFPLMVVASTSVSIGIAAAVLSCG